MKTFYFLVLLLTAVRTLPAQTEFSEENAISLLRVLSVDIGPRPMGSPSERRALEFAISKFREYGCDTVYIMDMPYSSRANTTSGIAVGIKRGATKRMIVVGGHIDSAGPEIPGADDDGSGSATVMEIARVLAGRSLQSTLVYCCWGGEEEGLEGSKYFADHFESLDNVALMLQIDMANGEELIELDPDTHGASAPRWLTRATIEEFYGLGYHGLRYPTHFFSMNYALRAGSGSDHESFLHEGIPAIDLTTDVTKPIHTPRDNFENFDTRGLRRSGSVMLKLIDRFDRGVPSRETEQYWFLLVGQTPIFVSFTILWMFAVVTIILATVTLISVRRRREPPDSPEKIRWSGVKMWLFSLVIVGCGWFSSDIIGMLKGVRFPWMTAIFSYTILAALGASIGVWIVLRWSARLKLSRCPYVFYKRAFIFLSVFTILLGVLSIKLLVEPAAGLFLVSLAMLVRRPFLKIIFVLLAPAWMMRLLFSEWAPLLYRSIAPALSTEIAPWILTNGGIILLYSIVLLPFLYAIAAVIRDVPELPSFFRKLRSVPALIAPLASFVVFGGFLLTQPNYDQYWYKSVSIEQSFDMNRSAKDIVIRGGEYLSGFHVRFGTIDTTFNDRTVTAKFAAMDGFDTSWVKVRRQDEKVWNGDSVRHNILLNLSMARRPYTVKVSYSGEKEKLTSFGSTWQFKSEPETRTISWYSFPDSNLRIPVEFTTAGNDSVKEHIDVTFDTLACPMKYERSMTYVIPRTKYLQSFVYKR